MSTSEIVVVSCNQGVTVGATMAIVGSSVQWNAIYTYTYTPLTMYPHLMYMYVYTHSTSAVSSLATPSAGECNCAPHPLPPSHHGSPTARHHPPNADKEDNRCATGNQNPQIVLSDSDDDIITSSLAESICSVQQFLKRDRLKRLKAPLFKL